MQISLPGANQIVALLPSNSPAGRTGATFRFAPSLPIQFIILFALVPLFTTNLRAQFGVSAAWRTAQAEAFDLEGSPRSFGSGLSLAADYWFRLKDKRIEFLPTLYYGQYETTGVGSGPADGPVDFQTDLQELGFQFRTNFYIFDFGTDCDCPTWGKQGPALHKGFFLQLAPGFSYLWGAGDGTSQRFPNDDFFHEPNLSVFSLGIGMGVDFGISNLITLTPQVSYQHYFGDQVWENAPTYSPFVNTATGKSNSLSNLAVGLRLGIRLDEKRY